MKNKSVVTWEKTSFGDFISADLDAVEKLGNDVFQLADKLIIEDETKPENNYTFESKDQFDEFIKKRKSMM